MEMFLDNIIVKFVLFIFAIVGVPLTIYFGISGIRKRKLSCYTEYVNLIRNKKTKFDKIKVLFSEEEVDNISISNFTIWNSGKSEIRSSDIAQGKELKIIVNDDSSILDAKILLSNEESNLLAIKSLTNKIVELSFDYIDEKEGGVIQIVHTGCEQSLSIDCKIKGGKGVSMFSYDINPVFIRKFKKKKAYLKFMTIMMILIFLIMFVSSLILTSSIYIDEIRYFLWGTIDYISLKKSISFAILFWIYVLFIVLMIGPILKRLLGLGIPSSLKTRSLLSIGRAE